MMKVTSIARLLGIASLVMFVGAARPVARKTTAAVNPMAAMTAIKPTAKSNTSAELLRDATPAAATIAPSVKKSRTIRMEVTAYCPCKKCCGPDAQGVTANGSDISYNNSRFVAADTDRLPFGTKLMIPGYDAAPVEVIDRGGAIKGHKLDVFFPTHQEALQWGRQWVNVTVVE